MKESKRGRPGEAPTAAVQQHCELADAAPVGLLSLTSEGLIADINLTAASMLGVQPGQLLNASFSSLIVDAKHETWQCCFSELLQQNAPPKFCELMLRHADGSQISARVYCRCMSGLEAPLRIAITDIFTPSCSGKEIAESLEVYRTAFENITDIYYRTDADGRVELVSPSCLALTGYTQEEILGRPATDFYVDAAQRKRLLKELKERGKVDDFEVILQHKDGSPRFVSVSTRLLPGTNAEQGAVEGILRDVSRRKKAEEKLRQSEERFRFLFEQAADYVLVLEPQEGQPPLIIDANRGALEKHGYSREELIGQPITFLDTEITPGEVKNRLQQLRSGQPITFETVHTCRDGTIFVADVVARQARVGDKTLIFTVERDISDRKRAEQRQTALLQENRKLIRRLMEVQEEERRLLARELHDELGQLLISIHARAEFIMRRTDDDELHMAAADIERNTQASFDASYATRMRLRPGCLDTLGLTASLSELSEQWRKEIGMDCALNIEGEIDRLDDIHAITVYRVMQEALTNAHRHGKATHVDVHILHSPTDADISGQLLIEVADNGNGMQTDGMPLGMGIIGMRERVLALGGSFHFTSKPGKGVRIEALLPIENKQVTAS